MDMAKLCGEDFGWARSDFVPLAKQTPQCPFAECVDWYCTLTLPRSLIIPDRSSDIGTHGASGIGCLKGPRAQVTMNRMNICLNLSLAGVRALPGRCFPYSYRYTS